ncbi:hypothetical protein [Mycolicibacterium sphagni]|uniref:hypothetical protein n=1 Tax=Mycolicibacterium sphagni TaxID=1786 RepID=UPI0021F34B4F|nr:hypothetical protein [Mycolicibacterium sphagni]MCV7176155.1 hypothetical protein [Mycolicibacterium sphagni]
MSDHNPFRAEIEQILTDHPHTRFAKVLLGMKRGLTDVEMSQEATGTGEPIRADGIAAVRRIVRLTLNDEFVTAPSEAEEQANVYRELLNHPRSPELHQHINTQLTKLDGIGPNVRWTPLGEGRLGANDQPRGARPQQKCEKCNLYHAGECQ